jgi:hypothetical protein
MKDFIKNRVHLILFLFNMILLLAGWVMASYAFPRLPRQIPLWLPFSGQPTILFDKTPLFFIYPATQTLFFVAFLALGISFVNRTTPAPLSRITPHESKEVRVLQMEFILLVLIFFHLVFIHIQRSLILLSHQIEKGISPFYFYSLFGIIILLIPYFYMRKKTLLASKKRPKIDPP